MTNRAKRMRTALESLGWEVENNSDHSVICKNCRTVWRGKFCGECGAKLPKYVSDNRGEAELEASMAYALGETRKKPNQVP